LFPEGLLLDFINFFVACLFSSYQASSSSGQAEQQVQGMFKELSLKDDKITKDKNGKELVSAACRDSFTRAGKEEWWGSLVQA
jgi:hypothetical protein